MVLGDDETKLSPEELAELNRLKAEFQWKLPRFKKNLRALVHRMSGNSKGNKLPTDELAMRAILKDMGVTEYEPRVVQQMLEFSYRYTTEVLEEAKLYSNHARKKQIDLDDVKLAVTNRGDRTGRMPPR